jgi:hypothetical protein
VGYYKLLFRGFRPVRLGRLKKLTRVSECQLHDDQQLGRVASVTVTWPSRRLTQSTRADAAVGIHTSISWTLAMTWLKRQTLSEYRWRCGSPARGDSTNEFNCRDRCRCGAESKLTDGLTRRGPIPRYRATIP